MSLVARESSVHDRLADRFADEWWLKRKRKRARKLRSEPSVRRHEKNSSFRGYLVLHTKSGNMTSCYRMLVTIFYTYTVLMYCFRKWSKRLHLAIKPKPRVWKLFLAATPFGEHHALSCWQLFGAVTTCNATSCCNVCNVSINISVNSWWRHQMETFSALLAFCAGNSPVPVNSPHKGQWRGALMFTLICAQINDWVNNHEAGDLRRHLDHYDVSVMLSDFSAHCVMTIPHKCDNGVNSLRPSDASLRPSIYVSKLTIIGSGNGLAPGRRQAIV